MSEKLKTAPALETRHIVKDFPGARALDGVSFDVHYGEVHGLVGENGAGKSTLIKILAGVHPAGSYSGRLSVGGEPARFNSTRDSESAGISVIHQELVLVKQMTVAENIFLGDEPLFMGFVDFDLMVRDATRLMDRLGVSIDPRAEVASLGVGERQMVELARALRKNSRILVLDEPTAALADNEVETLMELMNELRSSGTALVYISHKLDEVFKIADRITVLRDGKTVRTDMTANWTRQSVVRAMVGRELTDMFPKFEHELGDVVMEVEGLTLYDSDSPGRKVLEDISFSVKKGEILGIAGLMGAGRTELLSALFGAAQGRWTGKIRLDGREVAINSPANAIKLGIALAPEDRKEQGLVLMFSVLQNISMAHLDKFTKAGLVDSTLEFHECLGKTRELDIKTPSLYNPVETLSGGNQQKVVLGKWLLKTPKILLLDEPTRGIDVGAKAEIHRLVGELTRKGMAVVMASSELPELMAVCDRIMVLCDGRASAEFSCPEFTPEKIMEAAT